MKLKVRTWTCGDKLNMVMKRKLRTDQSNKCKPRG